MNDESPFDKMVRLWKLESDLRDAGQGRSEFAQSLNLAISQLISELESVPVLELQPGMRVFMEYEPRVIQSVSQTLMAIEVTDTSGEQFLIPRKETYCYIRDTHYKG